ncbi:formylglycine-generating enzyme family protein [Cylindrospermopsis sp. CR12]|uniref:formylglycine-generating enzyme family protein n=1 Tax=Cylindrospermopsis TaxID=77021 RepID=UPI0009EA915F|nr:formylglycine-generating enzyme family protein [Cylindrospermopsis sp. CR12]MBU6346249.1 formylglycine-generating enzyme family protein [Cyanobacteria bacterium REEB494]
MSSINQQYQYNAVLGGTVYTQEKPSHSGEEPLLTTYEETPHKPNIIGQAISYGEKGINLLFSFLNNGKTSEYQNGYSHKGIDTKPFSFNLVTTNKRGEIISTTLGYARSFIQDLGNGVNLEMVQIPGGKYLMGSRDERCDWEFPEHEVILPNFFMSKYPVTQEQYKAITGANPSMFKGDQLPVENVSWNNAVSFCEELAIKTGKSYTLPSETQWEYACRAGTGTAFYFGDSINSDLVNYNGNYSYGLVHKQNFRQKTVPVGSLMPNAYGLYDMHGNVYEWCLDDWHSNYNGAPDNQNPWFSRTSRWKVVRGGSWNTSPQDCRSTSRSLHMADSAYGDIGFRLVLNVS